MNRKQNNKGQNQGWVTLNDQQLRQIDGGDVVPTEQYSFNYEQIRLDYNPSPQAVGLLLPAVQAAREAAR